MATPWTVPREWVGETVAILGSGPSMSREMAESVRGRCRVIACNSEGVTNAPWADVLYAADAAWWRSNSEAALSFRGLKVTIRPTGGKSVSYPQVLDLQNGGPEGFDDRPTHLRTGGNSGYQAVHLAAHFGAARVLLLGFDMKPAEDGRQHWFGEHSFRPRGYLVPFALFKQRFRQGAKEFAKRGVRIINCTPGSALECFPFMDLEEALRDEQTDNRVHPLRASAEVRAVDCAATA